MSLAIVGGDLERRLSGRPTFPLNRLYDPAKRKAFHGVVDRIVDGTVEKLAETQGS